MKILFDGRVLAGAPSGVRDIGLGMINGLGILADEGTIDLAVVGAEKHVASRWSRTVGGQNFMQVEIPLAARRLRSDAIVIPRQSGPVVPGTRWAPIFHDVGYFKQRPLYGKNLARDVTTVRCGMAKRSLAVSEFTADEVDSIPGFNRPSPLPIGAIHRIEWSPESEQPYLLCVAAQEPHKNLARLISAWSKANTRSYRLVLCGRPGASSTEIASMIRSTKANHHVGDVDLYEGLNDNQYRSLLEGCFGYIQPSMYEGLCIPALDLAAAGAPVAVSNTGNLGHVFGNVGELSFDPHSVEGIAEAIDWLLFNEKRRRIAADIGMSIVKLTDWRNVASVAVRALK